MNLSEIFGVDPLWAGNRRLMYLLGDDGIPWWQGHRKRAAIGYASKDGTFDERTLYAIMIKRADEMIEKHSREVRAILSPKKRCHEITDDMIQQAREHPIENLIEVRKRKALCPFHDDHNPSMSIKNNRFKCFACGAKGDTINLAMKLHSLTFKDAVKWLAEYTPQQSRHSVHLSRKCEHGSSRPTLSGELGNVSARTRS